MNKIAFQMQKLQRKWLHNFKLTTIWKSSNEIYKIHFIRKCKLYSLEVVLQRTRWRASLNIDTKDKQNNIMQNIQDGEEFGMAETN